MLDPDRNNRLMDLFAEGVELDAEQRGGFVDRSCAGDPNMRVELAELLQVEGRGLGGFLADPAVTRPSNLGAEFQERKWVEDQGADGRATREVPQIAGYGNLVLIGQGGMGSVYRAQQYEPVRRTVAIKAIRGGMDSSIMLQRFEAERQALARMAHPYIATVHDAGTDARGCPYLAMEFVDGPPINEFCEAVGLELAERLELFAKVCEAVDHAHRRGVLHRDLKPSNVLVTRTGEMAMPKIIDFGIAKAIEGALTERTLLTEQGAFLGTPEYMSPEQLDGDARSVDTRTDVYALGAMLYELLTGALPFESERLRTVGLARMASILRNETAPKPSTRLRSMITAMAQSQTLSSKSQNAAGATKRTSWMRRLHGDLDWVVMKALDKDPEQRYATPREMADDLRRYLQNLPVHAGPPSGLYRLRRLTRRYRIQVAAGLLILLSLIVGLFGTLWFLFESQDQELKANRRTQEAIASERLATGSRIAAEAALVTQADPNLALLLAIEASRFSDPSTVADAVFGSLPSQDLLAAVRLRDHDARQAQFLPDGRLIVRTYDTVWWLVDKDGKSVIRRYEGHTDELLSMDVHADAGIVLTASLDATVRVWRIDDGTCLHVLPHDAAVSSVAYSADQRWFATHQLSGIVRVYDSKTFTIRYEFGSAVAPWSSFDFDQQAKRVLLHALDGTNEIRNLSDGHLMQRTPANQGRPAKFSRAVFGPRGDRIVRAFYYHYMPRTMQVLTLTGEVLNELPGHQLMPGPTSDPQIAFDDNKVAHVSLRTGEVLKTQRFEQLMGLVGRSPDGTTYVAIDLQEDLCLYDASTGNHLRDLAGRSDKRWSDLDVSFHPDGRRFAINGRELRVWTLAPDYAPFELGLDLSLPKAENLTSLACNENEALALVRVGSSVDLSWSLWSVDQRRKLRTLRPPGVERLSLSTCGTKLLGSGALLAVDGQPPRTRCVVLDLDGNLLHEQVLAAAAKNVTLHPDGKAVVIAHQPKDQSRQVELFDMVTGARRSMFSMGPVIFHLNRAPGHMYAAASYGPATRTDIFDLETGAMVRSIRGPMGASQYAEAVDPVERRLVVVLGDLRVRAFELDSSSAVPTGEYTRLVRSNSYSVGFIPHTDLAWAACANEVHVFHAVTCRPFAVLRLSGRIGPIAVRPDGSELLTTTNKGRCQRWPLNPVAIAKRMAVGVLDQRQLELFDVGTADERVVRERQRLQAHPSPRNWALLGERALADGSLDEAIACHQRGCALGPLGKSDGRRYVRLLELLARRMAAELTAKPQERDVTAAMEVLEHCLRCEVPRDELRALPHFDLILRQPELSQLLSR